MANTEPTTRSFGTRQFGFNPVPRLSPEQAMDHARSMSETQRNGALLFLCSQIWANTNILLKEHRQMRQTVVEIKDSMKNNPVTGKVLHLLNAYTIGAEGVLAEVTAMRSRFTPQTPPEDAIALSRMRGLVLNMMEAAEEAREEFLAIVGKPVDEPPAASPDPPPDPPPGSAADPSPDPYKDDPVSLPSSF